LLDTDFIATAQARAKDTIAQDRRRYEPILDFLLESLKNMDQIYLSDLPAILDGPPEYKESITIFTTNPVDLGKTLTNLVCKQFEDLCAFKTVIDEQAYRIDYDERRLCNINTIADVRNIVPRIKNIEIYGIQTVPVLMEMIRMLRLLYDPEKTNEWESTLALVKKAFPLIRFPTGSVSSVSSAAPTGSTRMKREIIDFLFEKDYLVFGTATTNFNIDIVSKNDLAYDVMRLAEMFKTNFGAGLVWKRKIIRLLNDVRFEKIAVYCVSEGTAIPVINLYHNAKYDILPYQYSKGYKVMDPIPLCRYYLINLYSALFQTTADGPIPAHVAAYIQHCFSQAKDCVPHFDIYKRKTVYGTYEGDDVYKKQLALEKKISGKAIYYCSDLL